MLNNRQPLSKKKRLLLIIVFIVIAATAILIGLLNASDVLTNKENGNSGTETAREVKDLSSLSAEEGFFWSYAMAMEQDKTSINRTQVGNMTSQDNTDSVVRVTMDFENSTATAAKDKYFTANGVSGVIEADRCDDGKTYLYDNSPTSSFNRGESQQWNLEGRDNLSLCKLESISGAELDTDYITPFGLSRSEADEVIEHLKNVDGIFDVKSPKQVTTTDGQELLHYVVRVEPQLSPITEERTGALSFGPQKGEKVGGYQIQEIVMQATGNSVRDTHFGHLGQQAFNVGLDIDYYVNPNTNLPVYSNVASVYPDGARNTRGYLNNDENRKYRTHYRFNEEAFEEVGITENNKKPAALKKLLPSFR